jgi:hypothetical protein
MAVATNPSSGMRQEAGPSCIRYPEACDTDIRVEEGKMYRRGVLQRFLWVISLSMPVWLVVYGAVRASEGAPSSATPRVVETEWPGVTVELTSVEPASDNTLMLKFKYVNSSSDTAEIAHNVNDILQKMYYMDTKNTRKYSAVRSATGLATILGTDRPGPVRLKPGQSDSFWVKFPAPPAEVERIDLYFPRALPMQNVPVR